MCFARVLLESSILFVVKFTVVVCFSVFRSFLGGSVGGCFANDGIRLDVLFEMAQIGMVDVVLDFPQCLLSGCRFQLAFPDGHHRPAHCPQLCLVFFVTLFVPFDFVFPEFLVAFGHGAVRFMSVPEAAVDENDCAVFAQDNIRRTGQPFHVFAVTVAPGEQVAAHNPFRFRVFAPYFRHDGGTLFLAPDVHAVVRLVIQK